MELLRTIPNLLNNPNSTPFQSSTPACFNECELWTSSGRKTRPTTVFMDEWAKRLQIFSTAKMARKCKKWRQRFVKINNRDWECWPSGRFLVKRFWELTYNFSGHSFKNFKIPTYPTYFLFSRQKDEQLAAFLIKAESNPLCRKFQLKDLLPVEMQRLAKYPLLLGKHSGENNAT